MDETHHIASFMLYTAAIRNVIESDRCWLGRRDGYGRVGRKDSESVTIASSNSNSNFIIKNNRIQ